MSTTETELKKYSNEKRYVTWSYPPLTMVLLCLLARFTCHVSVIRRPDVTNTISGCYALFWIFWRESFTARKKRLAARGSRLRLAGSQARRLADLQARRLAGSQNSLPLYLTPCKFFHCRANTRTRLMTDYK